MRGMGDMGRISRIGQIRRIGRRRAEAHAEDVGVGRRHAHCQDAGTLPCRNFVERFGASQG